MNQFQDAFISYGRVDSKAFASKLNSFLLGQGLEVWFDFDDIPLGVDYQKQIDDGIEKADNFLFIISPHSVNSPYCRLEIELALKYKKRLIPIMHVEQISQETWQQRFPDGTEEDWQIYQKKGLHSSFLNMHPEIAKINWVYAREQSDDFHQVVQNLLKLMGRDREYVRRHTYLLSKALEWDRAYRQMSLLLVREERKQAEEWLRYRFKDFQPPCVPTEIHCEYITESTKNANNLMTQVFLSWADPDRNVMEKVRHALMRENFTIWTSKTDIKTGGDLQQAINHGIEETDNVVYLMSSTSLTSRHCQQEIEYALSLNKRIIPILIHSVDVELIPVSLRNLQFIMLVDVETEYSCSIPQLLKILNHHADYYSEHKILLTKALKWERQHRNPCLLLRGYNLRYAEEWLKIAQNRDHHRPTPLIEEFIQESLRQPAGIPLSVFLSYSREDSELARRLNDALQENGKTTWFDQESIAAGSPDFNQEIHQGIENSDHFVFLISPRSIASPYCADEVSHAAKLNKRIITVLAQPVESGTLPLSLASIQWIDFSQSGSNFDSSLNALLRALDNDPDYLRTHTWLLVRALEWEQKERDEALLLAGNVLLEARQWLLANKGKQPEPTRLQLDFIMSSGAAQSKRHRATVRLYQVGLGLMLGISCLAVGAAWFAWHQYQEATRLQLKANREEILAHTNSSDSLFQAGRSFEALIKAMHAAIKLKQQQANDPEMQQTVLTTLQQAIFWVQEEQRLGAHAGIVWSVSISPDGKYIASASADGTVKIRRRDGSLVKKIESLRGEPVAAVTYAPNGQYVVMGGSDDKGRKGQASIVQLANSQRKNLAIPANVVAVAVSPDSQTIAMASEDSLIRLWDARGKLLKTLEGHDAPVRSVTFSPDGKTIASASDDATIRLWQRNGTPLKVVRGHTAQVRSVNYSRDGKRLVSASWDETVRVWRSDGTPLRTIEGHNTLVHDAHFHPNGTMIASAGWDKMIRLWTLDGTLISVLPGHTAQIRTLDFSPEDGLLISGGGDRVVRLWQINRPLLTTLQNHWAQVYSVAFSPQGVLASAGADHNIRLWTTQGKPLGVLKGHQGVVWQATYSPDGKTLASASSDYTIKLWNVANARLRTTLRGHTGIVYAVQYSADGKLLVSTGADQTVRLWRADGVPIRTLQGFGEGFLAVAISPDQKKLAVSGWDKRVKLMTLDGKRVKELEGHQGWVYHVQFSPDGKRLLTTSYDGTAKLWTRDGRLIITMSGHEDGVDRAAFSRDGTLIATASHDNTVKLWTSQGQLITTLRGHRDRVSDVAFSSDGKYLATASEDQTVLLWELDIQGDLGKLMRQSCEWMQDYLNAANTAHITNTAHMADMADMAMEIREYCAAQNPIVQSGLTPSRFAGSQHTMQKDIR